MRQPHRARCGRGVRLVARSHAQRVAVNDGTGTSPIRSAHSLRPAERLRRAPRASAAERVSFQRMAGRSGRPSASVTTSPCCWPATEIAPSSPARPVSASAIRSASHHSSGSVSRAPPEPVTVCGARPLASTEPFAGSTTSTFVPCVEQSTPATSGLTGAQFVDRRTRRV